MSEVEISVIVPTHNRADALEITLQKLAVQKFDGDWEVIVINNNCSDDTDEIVQSQQKKFPVALKLVHERIPGAAAARNTGVGAAKGRYLVFIDNDILTEPDFLQRHRDALQKHCNSWIVGQIINLPEQEKSVFGKYRKGLFPVLPATGSVHEIQGMTGANTSMPRQDFVTLGGFDVNFHVASGEDQELAMRARRELGVKVLLNTDILAIHNDWAGWTFPDFCARQSKYANTEYMFWKKYGNEHPRLQLILENLPIDWEKDSHSLKFRKFAKQVLGTSPAQSFLINASLLAESVFPFKFVLWRLYKLSLAGAIHQGFRKGMQRYEGK